MLKAKLDEIDVNYTHSTSALTIESDISDLTSSTLASVDSLNLTTGIAGDLLTDLLQDTIKNEHVQKNLDHRYVVGKALRTQVDECKQRLTAAFIFKTDTLFLTTKFWRSLQQKRRLPFSQRRTVEPSVLKNTRLAKRQPLLFCCQAELRRKSRIRGMTS